MSGHSKWANIKRKKEKVDAGRGKIFTKIAREIIVAAREGGGDPDGNFRLRLAIEHARSVNMPAENIERAIRRGTGELSEGENWEEVTYEGYGPGGVALLVQAMTSNRNRTASDIRYVFSRHGGNLGEAGCVAWMFDQQGLIRVPKQKVQMSEDEFLMEALDAGASDVQNEEDAYTLITQPADFQAVREAVDKKGIPVEEAEIALVPKNRITVEGKDAERVLQLIDALEDMDDVQNVYSNADIDESTLETVQA